jgi:quinol monooxygenase YgiN
MAQDSGHPFVRLAELEIDPAHLEQFKSIAREQAETALRVEPGALAFYALSIKDAPSSVRVFEMYTDESAYRAHLETPHFIKFRDATQEMVKSRKLIDTVPIILGTKAK